MSYKTQLKGQVNLGGAAFDLKAALPGDGRVALAGSNTAPLSFKHALSDVLKLSGSVLQLPPDFPDLAFEKNALHMTLSPGGVSLSGTLAAEWKSPFGILRGLTLRTFQVQYSSADRAIAVAVDADYGSLRRKGQLIFAGGELRVVVVTLEEINLGTILAMSLGIVWGPLNALILRARDSAQPIRLYYCVGPSYSGYEEGFRVDQVAVKIADRRAEISLVITSGKASLIGHLASDIDFKFLRISAPDYSRNGPEISVDDEERALTLDSGISFLGEALGRCEIAARPPTADGYELRGKIHSEVEIGVFKKPDFTFTWSKAKGFRVENWRIPDLPLDLNFSEFLNHLPPGGEFGAFASEMFKQSVQTRFDLSARVEPGPRNGLRFTLSGKYRVLVENNEMLSVPLPLNLIVLLEPDQFTFAALASAIRQAVESAGTRLVAQIVDPKFPDRSAKFFAAVLVPQFAEEAIKLILGRGWSAPARSPLQDLGPEPDTAPWPSAGPTSMPRLEHGGAATPDQYAAELKRIGMTCQQAATSIAGAYPALGTADLIDVFRRNFPETTRTPLLLLWALGQAGIAPDSVRAALLTLLPGVTAAAFASALRTVHPHPGVVQVVKKLQQSRAPALEAAGRIRAAFPTLTTTQIGYLLLVYFPQAVPDPRATGTALRRTGADERQVRAALTDLFPLLSPAEVETVAKSVFQSGR
jgi:hypothetical protein